MWFEYQVFTKQLSIGIVITWFNRIPFGIYTMYMSHFWYCIYVIYLNIQEYIYNAKSASFICSILKTVEPLNGSTVFKID